MTQQIRLCPQCGSLPIDQTLEAHGRGNLLKTCDPHKTNHISQFILKSMGKWLKVTGIFTSDEDANKWLENNKDNGVIACFDNIVITAHMYDKGQNVTIKELNK
tara:strand:+ start:398 stop:709 length:312 start_codon:yes stop_codon:yes gene_type:complete